MVDLNCKQQEQANSQLMNKNTKHTVASKELKSSLAEALAELRARECLEIQTCNLGALL